MDGMSTRIVAAMVAMSLLIGLLAGLLIGILAFRPGERPPQRAQYLPPASVERETTNAASVRREEPAPPDTKPMVALADRVCRGEENAVYELMGVADELYKNIDFQNDPKRVQANFVMMTAAYERIGQEAGKPNLNAMAALQQSVAEGKHVTGFATNALGTAAALGNDKALDMLLHHNEYGILKSSAVGALCRPASTGNPQAINFLISVLDDQSAKPLWNMASEGLRKPALAGNKDAAEALKRYAAEPESHS
jgi:hypothetical protein